MSGSREPRIDAAGAIEWHDEEGELHRVGGPPSKRHRDDGPAASYPDGRRVWFVEGEKVREKRSAPQTSSIE